MGCDVHQVIMHRFLKVIIPQNRRSILLSVAEVAQVQNSGNGYHRSMIEYLSNSVMGISVKIIPGRNFNTQ